MSTASSDPFVLLHTLFDKDFLSTSSLQDKLFHVRTSIQKAEEYKHIPLFYLNLFLNFN